MRRGYIFAFCALFLLVFAFNEIKNTGQAINSLDQSLDKTVYIKANGQLLAKDSNEVEYMHTNFLGSPVAISDLSGQIVELLDYSPFGETQKADPSYTGKMQTQIGTVNLGAREYSPQIARFFTPDQALIDTQSPYVYANNNPYRYRDPDGNFWETVTDVVSIGFSAVELIREPNWKNAGMLAADIGAAVVPFVPSATSVKLAGGAFALVTSFKKVDKVLDVVKGSKNLVQGLGKSDFFLHITDKRLAKLTEKSLKNNDVAKDVTKLFDHIAETGKLPTDVKKMDHVSGIYEIRTKKSRVYFEPHVTEGQITGGRIIAISPADGAKGPLKRSSLKDQTTERLKELANDPDFVKTRDEWHSGNPISEEEYKAIPFD